MSFKNMAAAQLRKYPRLKRYVKNMYMLLGACAADRRIAGNITRVSGGDSEHLFGYYDKSPWSASGKMFLLAKVSGAAKYPASDAPLAIIVKNMEDGSERQVAQSRSWCVQQGCMMQWLGPDFESKIIYNDFRDGSFRSVILDLASGREATLPLPVYSVSPCGSYALSLDFSRLHTLRPGYGYMNLPDRTRGVACPDGACIWRMEIPSGAVSEAVSYRELAGFCPRREMDGAFHKVNHIMINPSGARFMFLHRWIRNGVKFDRLFTADGDGGNMFLMLDDDMVSHSNWKNDEQIISYASRRGVGAHYYLLRDRTGECARFGNCLPEGDGHPSFSPDGRWLITDNYPSFRRRQRLFLCDSGGGNAMIAAVVPAVYRYRNATRCDLHPRWRPDSKAVCFDGALTSRRQVYILDLENEIAGFSHEK